MQLIAPLVSAFPKANGVGKGEKWRQRSNNLTVSWIGGEVRAGGGRPLLPPEEGASILPGLLTSGPVWKHRLGLKAQAAESSCLLCLVIYLPCPQPPLLQPALIYSKLT